MVVAVAMLVTSRFQVTILPADEILTFTCSVHFSSGGTWCPVLRRNTEKSHQPAIAAAELGGKGENSR